MKNNPFYDGTKLLSLKDINGQTPAVYLVESNRQAGKTTFFTKMCLNKFIKTGSMSLFLYRWKNELKGVASKLFGGVIGDKFSDYNLDSINRENGNLIELQLRKGDEKKTCGYVVAINAADKIRRASGEICKCDRIFLDEFQAESGRYCPDEVDKFLSIYMSVARGGGMQMRYVPVYMAGNPVSPINPYYGELGVIDRLNTDFHYLRGDGWVLEHDVNESAQNAIQSSAIARAFKNSGYIGYAANGAYLLNETTFIEPMPKGEDSVYIATLFYKGKKYGCRLYGEGQVWIGGKADESYRTKIAVRTEDHCEQTTALKANKSFMDWLKKAWNGGLIRFTDVEARSCTLTALSLKR